MFDLRLDARLHAFDLIEQPAVLPVLVQRPALARHHRHMPAGVRVTLADLIMLVCTPVARIGVDIRFFAMLQFACLRHVVRIGRRTRQGVYQPRIGVDADVCFHPEMPLVSLLRLRKRGLVNEKSNYGLA